MTGAEPAGAPPAGSLPTPEEATGRAGRLRFGAVAVVLVAALGCLVAGAGPWAEVRVDSVVGRRTVEVSAAQAAAGLAALAVIPWPALVVWWTGGRALRRAAGAVTLAVGLGVIAVTLGALRDAGGIAVSVATTGTVTGPDALTWTLRPWATLICGVLLALGGVALAAAGAGRVVRRGPGSAPGADGAPAVRDLPAQLWRSLDRGEDPTADRHDT